MCNVSRLRVGWDIIILPIVAWAEGQYQIREV